MPGMWDFSPMVSAMIFMVPIGIIILVFVLLRFFRAGPKMVGGFCMEAPAFAIPENKRGQVRADGTEIRTVRLPSKCTNCDAPLSPEDIDWVGPLEAKCNYCGSIVKAQFEKI